MGLIRSIVATALVTCSGLAVGLYQPAGAASSGADDGGQLVVIQAVPGSKVDVVIDGETKEKGVAVGAILGPYDLSAGSHEIAFTDTSGSMKDVTSSVEVTSGSSSDIVLHRPAEIDGDAVVNTYATPTDPIGPDKSRVLIAHTATVAPADVRVDGQTVFTNIANGEYAEADVPSGDHKVELLPTGLTSDPILGPLDVTLQPRTVTMVYAVGSPTNSSMNVIVHTAALAADGTVVPDTIDTGSAGLAADLTVSPFDSTTDPARAPGGSSGLLGSVPVVLAAAALLVAVGFRRPATRARHSAGRSPGTS
ncbi:conserved exported hypothetical protein [metagenome]|uniref:DUF4397 domain-containing protein n=1 Tax=metagenome TaxID=256318 RepID=A0A2P2CDY2_9ZZZZ